MKKNIIMVLQNYQKFLEGINTKIYNIFNISLIKAFTIIYNYCNYFIIILIKYFIKCNFNTFNYKYKL